MKGSVPGTLVMLVAIGGLFLSAGCGSPQQTPEEKPKLDPLVPSATSTSETDSSTATLSPPPPPAGVSDDNNDLELGPDVTLESGPLPIYEQFIRDHRGKVVAVDIWATHCVPCMQKFPKFVELAQKYDGETVVFASISLDDGDDPSKPHDFLVEKGAAMRNFLITDGQDLVQEKLEFEGIPHYLLYDREGNVHHFEDVAELAAQLNEWQQ